MLVLNRVPSCINIISLCFASFLWADDALHVAPKEPHVYEVHDIYDIREGEGELESEYIESTQTTVALVDNDSIYDVESLSAEEAFEHGRLLRAQFRNQEAKRYLKASADKGNASAAFLYAMELSQHKANFHIPFVAREYLLKSAKGNHRGAMNVLYQKADWLPDDERKQWKVKYHDSLILLGKSQPAEAFFRLAQYYQESDISLSDHYLDKAVDFQYPRALVLKAQRVEEGKDSGKRETVVREMRLAAASTGYIPAVKQYIYLLESNGDREESKKWRYIALKEGDLTNLAILGRLYTQSQPKVSDEQFIQGLAFLSIYLDIAGSDTMTKVYQRTQKTYDSVIGFATESQLREVETVAQALKTDVTFYNYDRFWDE